MKKSKLKQAVIDWLEDEENAKSSLEDLQKHGCQSGMVSELIYYCDTTEFYNKHKKEIIELTEDFCIQTGESLKDFLSHANNFPMTKEEIERESFVTGIDGLIKKNKDIETNIKNWFAWFGFEETAFRYYTEKYEN